MSDFHHFVTSVKKSVDTLGKAGKQLYQTDISKEALWETYLSSFPEGTNNLYRERTEYDCNCCRSFIRAMGNVVALEDNKLKSIWDIEGLKYPFDVVAKKLSQAVVKEKIVQVFFSHEKRIGTEKNVGLDKDGRAQTWRHFYCDTPTQSLLPINRSIESEQANRRDNQGVFYRSMDELTVEAGENFLDLIDSKMLYRGEEHKKNIQKFLQYKKKFDKVKSSDRQNWCWENSVDNPVVRIRNTAAGTLLIDLSNGVNIETAVKKFEQVMAPANYKRPSALITPKMVEQAQKTIQELGYMDSLGRRFAVKGDITINNVIFADHKVRSSMKSSVFDQLKQESRTVKKQSGNTQKMKIEDFISQVLPTCTEFQLLVENRHRGNFFSLIAPENSDAPTMFKWNNNFSWTYNGDITDSIKQNVKNAGGNVDGVFRFSIQWNDGDNNQNDFDAHCIEPDGNEIYYMKKTGHSSGGELDIDIRTPGNKVAVENIYWKTTERMREGEYHFFVHNYSHNGGKTGFTAQIEYQGETYDFSYDKELRQGEKVTVAKVRWSKKNGISFVSSLPIGANSTEVWRIKTNQLVNVEMLMYSPNYWDEQQGAGNKHYLFVLRDCKNDTQPRGFFNEFLKEELVQHKKVFEALGSKMKVAPSDEQLSGVGFSSTQHNSIIACVQGKNIEIEF